MIALVFAPPAVAERVNLHDRLTTEVAVVFPGAERFGMEEGPPPVSFVPTYQQIEL